MEKGLQKIIAEIAETIRIEKLIGTNKITEADSEFLRVQAEKGSPRAEFDYGFFLLLDMESKI